ncbi:nitroreductase family protein [Arabiibacter massiliensis]|uniref:nitroreductase family protein n=1 Tax=Arabiibacter massiliensis TaxID=1870985 RepID=UPI0009B9D29E|nr:nitroreductase family protein [Arabiibacter massiliensis]
MSFLNLAKQRCSIRAYEPTPVKPEEIATIVEAARVAPTAANRQPVRIIQVESEDGLAKLARGANFYGAPLAFIVCADAERAWKRPVDGMVSTDIDASIVCDHMMLAAADLGLGSLWICGFDPATVREAFDLPASLIPVNILAVGHAAGDWKSPNRHATDRIPLDELVTKA